MKVKDTLVTLETGDLDKSSTERSICQVQLQSLGDIRQIALKVGQLYNHNVDSVLGVLSDKLKKPHSKEYLFVLFNHCILTDFVFITGVRKLY